jgi:hypothetical protein
MTGMADGRRSKRVRRLAMCVAALAVAGASIAWAQQIWVGGGRGAARNPRWAQAADFDGSFLYCRGFFTSGSREPSGSGWSTDYPGADYNYSVRVAELTKIPIRFDEYRNPVHVVVSLSDPLLFQCPMLFMTHFGEVMFSGEEVIRLREYFEKGGFLWVDDAWGSSAWRNWVSEISRVLPPGEYPMFDIPKTHPLMRMLYTIEAIPQVPSINSWYRLGYSTSELGFDSQDVYVKGIQDRHQRLMVLMTHNTDISDTWEREGENQEYFDRFSPVGYAIGVNIALYAMTH